MTRIIAPITPTTHHRTPSTRTIEIAGEAGMIECGKLSVFLDLLPHEAVVLLAAVERSCSVGGGLVTRQYALHLTARGSAIQGNVPLCYCTFVAVEVSGVGNRGRLLMPCKETVDSSNVTQRARRLCDELQRCLTTLLEETPLVSCIHAPARYRLPDEWVWNAHSSLAGSGITFLDGHWHCLSFDSGRSTSCAESARSSVHEGRQP